jgi:hypothetical protein
MAAARIPHERLSGRRTKGSCQMMVGHADRSGDRLQRDFSCKTIFNEPERLLDRIHPSSIAHIESLAGSLISLLDRD